MSLQNRGVGQQSFDRTTRESRIALIHAVGGITIRGTVYLIPGTRFTDLVERDTEAFVAVTSATVTVGGQAEHANFVAVNKLQIVTMEEVSRGEEELAVVETEA